MTILGEADFVFLLLLSCLALVGVLLATKRFLSNVNVSEPETQQSRSLTRQAVATGQKVRVLLESLKPVDVKTPAGCYLIVVDSDADDNWFITLNFGSMTFPWLPQASPAQDSVEIATEALTYIAVPKGIAPRGASWSNREGDIGQWDGHATIVQQPSTFNSTLKLRVTIAEAHRPEFRTLQPAKAPLRLIYSRPYGDEFIREDLVIVLSRNLTLQQEKTQVPPTPPPNHYLLTLENHLPRVALHLSFQSNEPSDCNNPFAVEFLHYAEPNQVPLSQKVAVTHLAVPNGFFLSRLQEYDDYQESEVYQHSPSYNSNLRLKFFLDSKRQLHVQSLSPKHALSELPAT